MKHYTKLLILTMALIMGYSITNAQKPNRDYRISREQLAIEQAKYIAHEIEMDDSTTDKFINIYCQMQKEVWALGPRQRPRQSMTDEETEEAIKKRFDHTQKILDLRQKYYILYSKFLTQRQIQRVYELEKQMINRLSGRHGKRNKQ